MVLKHRLAVVHQVHCGPSYSHGIPRGFCKDIGVEVSPFPFFDVRLLFFSFMKGSEI